MVMGPVCCHIEIYCTTIFALQNGRFSSMGVTHPHTPISFVSTYRLLKLDLIWLKYSGVFSINLLQADLADQSANKRKVIYRIHIA